MRKILFSLMLLMFAGCGGSDAVEMPTDPAPVPPPDSLINSDEAAGGDETGLKLD